MLVKCIISLSIIVVSIIISTIYYFAELKKPNLYIQKCKGTIQKISIAKMGIETFISTLSVSYEIQGKVLRKDISISGWTCSYKVGESVGICYSEHNPSDAHIEGHYYNNKPKQMFIVSIVISILITGYLIYSFIISIANTLIDNIFTIGGIAILFGGMLIYAIRAYAKEKSMQKLISIIKGEISLISTTAKAHYIIAEFNVNGKRYCTRPMCKLKNKVNSALNTGDTVNIKYSTENPGISIIADDVYSFASKKKAVLVLLAVSIFIILITGFNFLVM